MIKPDLKQRDSATQFRVFLRVALSVGQENKFWDALSGVCGADILGLFKYSKIPNKGRALYSRTKNNLACALFI